MQDEMVDIVDDQDKIIGSISKIEAHKNGSLHRTVISEIIDSQGRFILVKQASDRQDAGQYVSPVGGHVQSGETADDALKREAQEETGLQDFSFHLVGKAIFNRTVIGRQENHFFILYEIHSDEKLVLNHESIEYRAFTKDEITEAIAKTPEMFGAAYYYILEQFYPALLPKNYQHRYMKFF